MVAFSVNDLNVTIAARNYSNYSSQTVIDKACGPRILLDKPYQCYHAVRTVDRSSFLSPPLPVIFYKFFLPASEITIDS